MVTSPVDEEVRSPDGRVSLASADELAGTGYANGDLAPLPLARRTWGTYNYAALWIGMSHNIPTYLLASGLIAVGMNWVQALITIALATSSCCCPCWRTATPGPSTASRSRCSPGRRSGCGGR